MQGLKGKLGRLGSGCIVALAVLLCGRCAWGGTITVPLQSPIPSNATHIGGYVPVSGESAYAAVGDQIQTAFWDSSSTTHLKTITFDFQNIGTIPSIITGIFFQDGSWLTAPPYSIADNSGVVWTTGGNPSALPGGSISGFTTDVSLDTQDNQKGIGVSAGINNGGPKPDELQLTFQYVGTMS